MKEYEATGKFVNISKYKKKMDSEFGFWQNTRDVDVAAADSCVHQKY